MDIAAEAVAGAVAEFFAVAGFFDDVARGLVDFFAVGAGFDGGDGGEFQASRTIW